MWSKLFFQKNIISSTTASLNDFYCRKTLFHSRHILILSSNSAFYSAEKKRLKIFWKANAPQIPYVQKKLVHVPKTLYFSCTRCYMYQQMHQKSCTRDFLVRGQSWFMMYNYFLYVSVWRTKKLVVFWGFWWYVPK